MGIVIAFWFAVAYSAWQLFKVIAVSVSDASSKIRANGKEKN